MNGRGTVGFCCVLLSLSCFPSAGFGSSPNWSQSGPVPRSSQSMVFDPTSGQTIVFAGLQTNTNTDLNDVWLGQIAASTLVFSPLLPTGITPPGRYGHVTTYDSSSNTMTVFGGALGLPQPCGNDVWILQAANGQGGSPAWVSVTPSGATPAARFHHSAVYDSNNNELIVFGGSDCSTGYFNDVWILSNANGQGGASTWTQLSPNGPGPPAREGSTVVYDSLNNIMILYGGDAGGNPFGDVWVLSNANGTGGTPVWSQLFPSGAAPAIRTGHTAIYDGSSNRMIVFAGATAGGGTLSDTWALTSPNGIGSSPSWIKLKLVGTPPNLAFHSSVYDPAQGNMYVFGGSSTSTKKLQSSDHAFLLSHANGLTSEAQWFVSGPPVRYSHAAFYDPSTNSMFVYGGQHSNTLTFGDYWRANGVIGSTGINWSQVVTGGGPGKRFGHAGLYDPATNRMMVFGGANGYPGVCKNDYWVLKNANTVGAKPKWVSVTALGTAPATRMRHNAVYDANTNSIVLFGGYDCNSTYFNDVWVLSNANNVSGTPSWARLAPTGGPPSPRENSAVVYDSLNNILIIYAGDAGASSFFADVWVLSNANGTGGTPVWTQLNPGNGPAARSGHTATYDAVHNTMTIEGGFNGSVILGDTWTLSGANGFGTALWMQLVTPTAGPVRRFHSSFYDPVSAEMVVFVGATFTVPQNPSSDIFVLSDPSGVH